MAETAARRGANAHEALRLYTLAVARAERGETAAAEDLLRRAADLGDVDALNRLAVLLADQGRLPEAEELLRTAIDAGNVDALNNLGVLLKRRGETGEAERLYRRAIDNGNRDAVNNLANLLAAQGQPEEAEFLYRDAIEAGNHDALNNLANLIAKQGGIEEALRLYRRAIGAGVLDALNNLAVLMKRKGETGQAERLYRLAIDAGNVDALHNLAHLLAERGRMVEAEPEASVVGPRTTPEAAPRASVDVGPPLESSYRMLPTERAAEPPARLLTGSVPTRAPLGEEISLIVRVVMEDSANMGLFSSPLAALDIPAGGLWLTIVVESHAGLLPLGPVQQPLLVPPVGDSKPIRFPIRTTDVGLHDLTVTAWAGGTYVGNLQLQVSVAMNAAVVDGGVRRTDLAGLTRRQGEATLQVLVNGGQYMFQLLAGDDLFDTVPGDKLTEDPSAAVQRAREELGKMSRGSRASGYTAPNAVSLMKNLGVGLWNAMIPRELQEQFWSIRDQISMFTIASAKDAVPWEMVYPKSPGNDHGFLVEQFPVLRRMHQHRSKHICTTDARFVVPPGAPTNAADEIARIRGVLDVRATRDDVITDLEPLLALIESGSAGLLHFACHNTFDAAAGGAIGMNGGAFVPDLLNTAAVDRALHSRSPLVFLNACSSAADVPRYTDMMGFASQFMRAGAGAFVGTLWDVRSDAAGRFAEDFYARLRELPLGEAAFASRTAMRDADSADPTWLAYTVFGDPGGIAG